MSPEVQTTGGTVRGQWNGATARFLGIPFAAPPVGALRFAAPQPPEAWTGIRDAVAFGPTAQRGDPGATLIPEPSIPGDDILTVNVFTPKPTPDAALPVLFYIHGGGFVGGSPASPWYDGAAFARDGIVTVTIGYRLGFDGFGWIDGAASNRAVLDWIAALNWVQANIAAFGGDPARVTLVGQSAGAAAVLTLLTVPKARGLFHAAWAMSSPQLGVPLDAARARTVALSLLAGVPATLGGLSSVPADRIIALQSKVRLSRNPIAGIRSTLGHGLPWGPVIDGDLIPQAPLDALAGGASSDIPLVLGATDDEFTMSTDGADRWLRFAPAGIALGVMGLPRSARRAYLDANSAQRALGTGPLLGRFVTDSVFRSTVLRVIEARGDAPTWAYRFAWPSPVRRWSLHCLDVPFFFDVLDGGISADGTGVAGLRAIAGDAPPQSLADDVHSAAVALVREGAVTWPETTDAARTTRVFNAPASTLESDAFASARALL